MVVRKLLNKRYTSNYMSVFILFGLSVTYNGVEDKKIQVQVGSKFLPMDWSLKTKLRILSETPIPGTQLKTNQEASGLTGFVRCIDHKTTTTGLDISPGAQLHQSKLYWEHPHLPWLTCFPRNSKLNSKTIILGEIERTALMNDWRNSFTSLFQLVRTRQCPYFYVCTNSFTTLFRAPGVGGRVETHALVTPTTRGLRAAFKKESIEFTMPLKRSSESQHDKSMEENGDEENESKIDNDDDEEEDEEKWLESLGVSTEEIKKMQSSHSRKIAANECEHDFSDVSLALIEGFECQALFNFLLNAKSTVTKVGKLAGIPPTLLSPVAFEGGTLKSLQTVSSKVRMEGLDYFSLEMKGVILPHVLPYVCDLLKSFNDCFAATLYTHSPTTAFSKASEVLIQDIEKDNNKSSDFVFGRENLSDCGISSSIIEAMCRVDVNSIQILERICFNKDIGGFTWNLN